MIKPNKLALAILMLACSLTQGHAEDDDKGSISSIKIEYDATKHLEIELENELRTIDYLQTIERWNSEITVNYTFFNFLKISNGYSLLRYNHEKRGWETGYRFFVGATGFYKWNNFKLSLSEKYQQTYRKGVAQKTTRDNPKKILKSKLKLKYKITKLGLEPYISTELYHDLKRRYKGKHVVTKYEAGVSYAINKRNEFSIYYRYQKEEIEGDANKKILGIGYTFKL